MRKTVVIRTEIAGENLVSVFTHLKPKHAPGDELKVGDLVSPGDLLGTTWAAKNPDSFVAPHLHFALAVIPQKEDWQKKEMHYDICPDCGQALLAREEGCAKCYGCGHSEC